MLQNKYLKDWSRIVSYHFPHLSLPEVIGLASWSFGIVLTSSSSLTRVSEFIAKVNGEKVNTVRKRLKEWYQDDWQVIVSADRGLYADWLFAEICTLNWHPFLRINYHRTYRVRGENEWQSLETVVPQTAMSWSGLVTCFKTNPIDCTLLACWSEGYKTPWLIITDLEPEQGNARWYSFRSWIESSYRDVKSDGWQ